MSDYVYNYPSGSTRKSIKSRDKWGLISKHPICVYCGSENVIDLVIDHIYPVSKGGRSNIENLTISCGSCNSHKYNHTIDFFAGIMYGKRSDVRESIGYYIKSLRQLRTGRPAHRMHTDRSLVDKISRLRHAHSYFTKIIHSLIHEKYKIFN